MDNSLLKLILSLQHNPGVYALLLGSGISKAAGIPTGWEIVTDLINRLATASGGKMEPDAETWYRAKFGQEPRYSDILERICPTPTERSSLLRSYFEPTEEQREQGLKIPTAAHKTIASLVKNNFIKIILTTNFDRLLENALEEQGITPDVISSDDMLEGAIPYVHSKCTIIKLHGDYRDIRIKNTPEELSSYSVALNHFLARILDEFGLIICGWSGEWDIALQEAIVRCPTRRFTTYWCAIGEPGEDAKRIIQNRHAEVIQIRDANTVFGEILERALALQDMTMPNPVSGSMATALTKRFLSEERYRIRLHDLIAGELENVHSERSSPKFKVECGDSVQELKTEFQRQLKVYESVCDSLINILATTSYFDKGSNSEQVKTCIERLLEVPVQGGKVILLDLLRYPALLVAYATGISALAAKNYENLAAVLIRPRVMENGEMIPGVSHLYPGDIFSNGADKWVPIAGAERKYIPANEYIQEIVRNNLKNLITSEVVFEATFDIFEYIIAITYMDILIQRSEKRLWAPTGCFGWRYIHRTYNPIIDFFQEGVATGDKWGFLTSGFFGGSLARLQTARQQYAELLKVIHAQWR